MNRIIFIILFFVCVLSSNAQNYMFLSDVESELSDNSLCLEGFYNISIKDEEFYLYMGSVYAISCFDIENNKILLCLQDSSEIPQFLVYTFCIDSADVYLSESAFGETNIKILNKNIYYLAEYIDRVYDSGDMKYYHDLVIVQLQLTIDNFMINYSGEFIKNL